MSGLGSDNVVRYRRARFATRLPADALYTASHHWLRETAPGCWHVGLTGFASRMLGELVEVELQRTVDQPVALGEKIGWIEGFKAISDLYCVADGRFCGANISLDENVTLFDRDPGGRGWLYEVEGTPDPDAMDVHAYVGLLDATIDRMLAEEEAQAP